MSNVFTEVFPKNTEVIEVKGLGKVTIVRPTIKEYKETLGKHMTKGSELTMEEGLAMQFEFVSMALVEPKMTVEELEALPKDAMSAIAEIFQISQVTKGDEEGN